MASNQELRQASVRAATGTAYTYNDDWMALFTADGITSGTFNDRMRVWINDRLGTSYATLPDAQRAFAIDQGFSSWSEMGTFNPSSELNFVAHGDSMTNFGAGNYVERLIELIDLERPVDVAPISTIRGVNGASWNYAWPSGDPIISLEDDAAAEIDANITSGKRNILFLFAGSNGIAINSNSAAVEYAAFESYLADRLAAGWQIGNIYVLTMLERSGVSEVTRGAYNDLLRAGVTTYGYTLVDLDLDARLVAPDVSVIGDGVHPTELGHRIIAQNVYDAFFETLDTAPIRWEVEPVGFGVFSRGDDNTVAYRTNDSGAQRAARSDTFVSDGLRYAEVEVQALGAGMTIGIGDSAHDVAGAPGYSATSIGYNNSFGDILKNSIGTSAAFPGAYTTGDVIGVLVDLNARTVRFNLNNGAFCDTVSLSGLDTDIYLIVGMGITGSTARLPLSLNYAVPTGATEWWAGDNTPAAFSFTDVTGATISTLYESNTITVSGMTAAAVISVTGGEYSINGGTYTSAAGTVSNGDTVKVRTTSSGSNLTAVNVVLTIGGVSDTYTVTTEAGGAFTPANLFALGENGSYYDISDTSTLWQDAAGTVPVTASNDPVGRVDDLSGNGNHLTQSTSGNRPKYMTAGGLHWLAINDSTDFLQFPNFVSAWTSGTGITAQRSDDGGSAPLQAFGTSGSDSHEPFTDNNVYCDFGATSRPTFGTLAQSTDYVISRVAASGELKIYADKVQNGSTASVTIGFGSSPKLWGNVYITTARFYGGVIREGTLSAQDRADTETWCGNLQGRSI